MDKTQQRFSIGPIATCIAAALVATYVWGYLASEPVEGPFGPGPMEVRFFRTQWQATLYIPAAHVESLVRGTPVAVGYE